MLGIVLLLYVIMNTMILALFGLIDGDGSLTVVSLICSLPLILIFISARRPKLTHVIMASPEANGTTQHMLPDSRMLVTPVPT